jgi:hypothetical protein
VRARAPARLRSARPDHDVLMPRSACRFWIARSSAARAPGSSFGGPGRRRQRDSCAARHATSAARGAVPQRLPPSRATARGDFERGLDAIGLEHRPSCRWLERGELRVRDGGCVAGTRRAWCWRRWCSELREAPRVLLVEPLELGARVLEVGRGTLLEDALGRLLVPAPHEVTHAPRERTGRRACGSAARSRRAGARAAEREPAVATLRVPRLRSRAPRSRPLRAVRPRASRQALALEREDRVPAARASCPAPAMAPISFHRVGRCTGTGRGPRAGVLSGRLNSARIRLAVDRAERTGAALEVRVAGCSSGSAAGAAPARPALFATRPAGVGRPAFDAPLRPRRREGLLGRGARRRASTAERIERSRRRREPAVPRSRAPYTKQPSRIARVEAACAFVLARDCGRTFPRTDGAP